LRQTFIRTLLLVLAGHQMTFYIGMSFYFKYRWWSWNSHMGRWRKA